MCLNRLSQTPDETLSWQKKKSKCFPLGLFTVISAFNPPSDPCGGGVAQSAAVLRRPLSLSLLWRMYRIRAAIGTGGTYHLHHFRGVGVVCAASFFKCIRFPILNIFCIYNHFIICSCAWTKPVWPVAASVAHSLDFSSSFTPPPLPPLFSYPVVQRGQVNGGRHDDRWLVQSEGLIINTKQLTFSCTHTNTGVHTHSRRPVDSVFTYTPASRTMTGTQLLRPSTANKQ